MAIDLSFTNAAMKRSPKQKTKAAKSLVECLNDVPSYAIVLIDKIGADIIFHNIKSESGASDYPNKVIEQNLKEFSRFEYKSQKKPSHNQRWAVATLKEEFIHYLAEHYGFDNSQLWQKAAYRDLMSENKIRDKLFKKQRDYDSSESDIKITPKEYAKDISLSDTESDELYNEWEPGEELLVDLILIRDYLKAKSLSSHEIEKGMNEALPITFTLAMQFEQRLQEEAQRIAVKSDMSPEELAQNIIEGLTKKVEEISVDPSKRSLT